MTLNPPSPVVRRVLEHLASAPTNGHGYKSVSFSDCTAEATDAALALLFRAGLINAFVKPSGNRSQYHPSSLTPAGRRAVDAMAKQDDLLMGAHHA